MCPRPQWRCQEDVFSHCVVKVNYVSLERRKVYFVWGWKFFLEVPFEYLKDGLRKAIERAFQRDALRWTKAGPVKKGQADHLL